MSACLLHPERPAEAEVAGRGYCASCRAAQQEAARTLAGHVCPRECFVEHAGRGQWRPIREDGSAHWVAHELGIREPGARDGCLAGYAARAAELLRGRRHLGPGMGVRAGDLYLSLDRAHCGLVVRVELDQERGLRIWIRHASGRLGRVATSDFYGEFLGAGSFHR